MENILKTFGMYDVKLMSTPVAPHFKLRSVPIEQEDEKAMRIKDKPYSSVLGSLMYGMIGSRPVLAHAVGLVSRFMSSPGRKHWDWLNRF